jgi:restriction system protein
LTIVEAIKEALKLESRPLTYKEIYKIIIDNDFYNFGAKKPETLVNSKIRKHCLDLDFPSASPAKHFRIASKDGRFIKYTTKENDTSSISPGVTSKKEIITTETNNKLPEEKIQDAYLEHRENIKQLLLDEIIKSDPAFFERLVVDVLLAMGYGGDFPGSGFVTGGSADGGIDGIIKEDKLGLDKIYIQAKRYSEKSVGRPEIQQFVGAMESVNKGVFITTSTFSKPALEFAEKNLKSLVLINGSMLCDLMLNHSVGISLVKTYSTFKVDSDYFMDD